MTKSETTLFIASNFHQAELPGYLDELTPQTTAHNFPQHVTLGFRGVFWSVFSRVYRQNILPVQFQFLDMQWSLHGLHVLELDLDHFPVLSGEQTRFIVVFEVKLFGDLKDAEINEMAFRAGLDEQGFVATLLSALSGLAHLGWLATCKHNLGFPARFITTFEGEISLRDTGSVLAGFFFLGNLLIWQIQRETAQIELSVKTLADRKAGSAVLQLRQKVINMDRFVLSKNITNRQELKDFSSQIKSKLGLRRKYEGLLPLTEAIVNFHDTATALRQERHSNSLNALISVVSVVGISISFIAMMLALDGSNILLNAGMTLFTDRSIVGTLGLVGAIAFAATYFLSFVWVRIQRRN